MNEGIKQREGLGFEFAVGLDEHGLHFAAFVDEEALLARLRWQAFESARLLCATASIEQQLIEARVLLPAMQRWSARFKLHSRMSDVLLRACAEANSAEEAIKLAERLFSFLLPDEAPLSAFANR